MSRRLLCGLLVLSLTITTISCGTLLYPERRGQPAGRLDPAIVALNAVGLLLFLIPGIIAFAVDFATGAIYLPPGEYSALEEEGTIIRAQSPEGCELVKLQMQPERLTRDNLESLLRKHTGEPVNLQDSRLLGRRLPDEKSLPSDLSRPEVQKLELQPVRLQW